MTLLNKYIGKSNFRIGLGYTKFGTFEHNNDILRDKSYFNVSLFNTEYRYSRETGQQRTPYLIPYDYCNDSFSEFVEEEVVDRFQLQTHICPSTDDYYLVGDVNSIIYRDIEILVTPCSEDNNQGVIWKSQEEINEVINTGFINVPITVSYFDFDNYESPVKTILSEPDDHYLLSNTTTWVECFIRENTALTSDNILFNEPFKETKFYDIGTQNIKTINQGVTGGAIFFISIGNYAQTIQFERTVYSLLDLFGYLGGLYDFMLVVGFLFVNGFQDKIYQNLISSNMYQVKRQNERDESEGKLSTSAMIDTKNNWFNNSIINVQLATMRRINQSSVLPELQLQNKNEHELVNNNIDTASL